MTTTGSPDAFIDRAKAGKAVRDDGGPAFWEGKTGKWFITYDPPPIPIRICDWHFVHEDYDGAPIESGHLIREERPNELPGFQIPDRPAPLRIVPEVVRGPDG